MDIKAELYSKCKDFIDNRIQTIQNTINEIQESLLSETKSSAGDKHETGRAMLQLEREKSGQQLAQAQKVKETLSKIDTAKTSTTICLGSIVYTTQANYYISISAGQFKVNNDLLFAISPNTPIARILLTKKTGDEIVFREQTIKISKVL
jgi:transcription elongation GreA/GreB family factor